MKNIIKYIARIGNDESGMGVIEIVLIILVLIGLALVFKNQINGIASGIFNSIKTQIRAF